MSSSSSYCQDLQSCLVEPRVLRLKLAPPKANISRSSSPPRKPFVPGSDCDSKSNTNVDMGGLSFLQSLASIAIKETTPNAQDNKIYTPPNVKRSSSMLSEKSLEMCTESLGSETGSDVSDSSDEMTTLVSSRTYVNRRTTRMNRSVSFPPPLTSISGSTNVQVRPYREGGRLVLEAVATSIPHAYFHAERANGRLRLHLMKDFSADYKSEEEAEEEEEEEEEEEADGGEKEVEEGGVESEESGEGDDEWGEELEGNNVNVGDEMGMGELPRPSSRCKEGGSGSKDLLNWETFWVST